MNDVVIAPLPHGLRSVPDWLWPACPPVRITCEADRELAQELFNALDKQSKDWYRSRCSLFADS